MQSYDDEPVPADPLLIKAIDSLSEVEQEHFWILAMERVRNNKEREADDISEGTVDDLVLYLGEGEVRDVLAETKEDLF